jgi:rod shape-determining protein MreC
MVFLLRLIKKNLFIITYFALLFFSLSQIFRFNIYQKSYFFNTSNSFFNTFSRAKSAVNQYFILKYTNETLAEENRKLREQLASSHLSGDKTEHIKNDSLGKKMYSYLNAQVIQAGTSMQNNFITIDKGFVDGIKKDMAVIGPSGIAGIVVDVTENFSLVLSVLNSQFKATPMIPAIGFRDGWISWNGKDPQYIQLSGVSRFEKVKPGMEVLTSNYSVKFPAGIPIGKIARIHNTGKSSFYEIDITPSTDFRRLSQVYVVNNRFLTEQDSLINRRNERGR